MTPAHPGTGRLRFLQVGVFVLGILLAVRVVQVQVFQHDRYKQRAEDQWAEKTPIDAVRGNLYDRRGEALALSVRTWKLGVAPTLLPGSGPSEELLATLAPVVGLSEKQLRRKIRAAGESHVVVGTKIVLTLEQKKNLRRFKEITFEDENTRVYPHDGVGAALVGFYRNSGGEVHATGLEYSLGGYLDGRAGLAQSLVTPDPHQHLGHIVLEEARHGQSLELTIDARLQAISERRLEAAVARYGAIGGSVLILEPSTGDVLAAASWPLVGSRSERQGDLAVWNNRNFTQAYEPGSIFKIFSMASMLRHGAIDTATVFDCSNGDFGKFRIRNDDGHSYGDLPLMRAFSKSSNIYFARAVGNLAADELYRDLVDFGFGQPTSLPYPGQGSGLLQSPVSWSGRSKPTISIGQEVSATPLQIGMAVCAVANGGELMAPRLVRRVLDHEGRVREEREPVVLRRVLSEPLSVLLREAMDRVVREGTGVGARVDWISVGGKTGTAQKSRDGLGYTSGAYIASFAALLPVEQPRLVILTVLDEPTGTYHYAAQSAVPLFREIVTDIKNRTRWLSDAPGARTGALAQAEAANETIVPDVLYLSVPNAAQRLGAAGLGLSGAEKHGVVVQQVPAPGTRTALGTEVVLTVSSRQAAADSVAGICPDFAGLSNRQARSLAARLGLDVEISGAGYVAVQQPAPGQPVPGEAILLRMRSVTGDGTWN